MQISRHGSIGRAADLYSAGYRFKSDCRLYLVARWLSWLERRPVTAEVEGSNPFRVVDTVLMYQSYNENGILAQLGEHLPYKQRVTGSSPVGPIKINMAK